MSKIQVIFTVGRGSYSFDSQYVRAVEIKPDIKLLPGAPDCISGLAELRGELIPVCDLNRKFNTGAAAGPEADVIFVNTADGCLGCTVDKVVEIGAITEDLEIELPYLIRSAGTEYIDEIVSYKGGLVTAIAQDRILSREEKEALSKVLDKALKSAAKKAEEEAAKAAEQAAKEAAKEAEKAEKEAAKEAERAAKEAAKAAEKAEKEAAKAAEKAEKEAAKAAEKAEKEAAKAAAKAAEKAAKEAEKAAQKETKAAAKTGSRAAKGSTEKTLKEAGKTEKKISKETGKAVDK